MARTAKAPGMLTTGDVARRLGVTPKGVRGLDAELHPIRDAHGGRRYFADVVDRVAADREFQRARRCGRAR